jgi:hypothetical protein
MSKASRKLSASIHLRRLRRNFERGIAHTYKFPVPRLTGKVTPVELERGCQRIDLLFEQLRNFALAAINPNSARPLSAPLVNLYAHAECTDLEIAHISKSFVHTFKHTRAIIAPLIMIIAGYEIPRSAPVFMLDCMKKVLGMTLDLTFGPPERHKKQRDKNDRRKPSIKYSTQRDLHNLRLNSSRRVTLFYRRIVQDFFEDGSTGSVTD